MSRNTCIVNQLAVPVSSPKKYEGRQFVTQRRVGISALSVYIQVSSIAITSVRLILTEVSISFSYHTFVDN